jgi:dTDP-6-deoxy-L-talose 4-dehydrogenase (NAD+)
MKILVTGATGFIGRFVIEKLLDLDCDVIATATKDPAEVKNILPCFSDIDYIAKNLNDKEDDYFSFFKNPEALIHLSWEGLPNYKELFHIERNLPSNYCFIKNMIEHGLNDITITGTCFEYGLQDGCLHEDMEAKPVTNYGLAKDCLRKFVYALQSKYKFSYKWLRLFYPFGPGQGAKSLYSQMMNVITTNGKEFNMSPGEQLRDYLPVETMAGYIVTVALQNNVGGIINCCSGKPVSVRSFVEDFFKQHNYPIKLNLGYYPYPDYEPLAFWGDTGKLMKIMGNLGRIS